MGTMGISAIRAESRHYWLAPRSDDAVGAGLGLEQGAAWLQQLDIDCRRFGPAGRIGGAVGPVGAGRAIFVPDG